jgi:hypothetical protein
MRIYKTWTQIKEFLTSKNLLLQYHEYDYKYSIFVTEADGNVYFTELWTDTSKVEGIDVNQNNTDLQDFEDNYKSNANQSAIGSEGNIQVEVIKIPRYSPRFYNSTTKIDIEDTVTLVDLNFEGKIYGISVNFSNKKLNYILEVDGVEILDINFEDIANPSKYNLNSTRFENFILTSKSNCIAIKFDNGLDITNNLKVKASSSNSGVSTEMKGILVAYGIKIQ